MSAKVTAVELLARAERKLREAKEYLDLINPTDTPPILIEKRKQEFARAKQEYDRLHFLFVDHALRLPLTLAELNKRHEQFWSQR